jgi:hypothetical protein
MKFKLRIILGSAKEGTQVLSPTIISCTILISLRRVRRRLIMVIDNMIALFKFNSPLSLCLGVLNAAKVISG